MGEEIKTSKRRKENARNAKAGKWKKRDEKRNKASRKGRWKSTKR